MTRNLSYLFLVLAAVAVFLPSHAAAQATVSGTLGVSVDLTANTETTINFGDGSALIVTSDVAAAITMDSYATVGLTPPSGTGLLSISSTAGYEITVNPSSANIEARIVTDTLGAVVQAALTGRAGCLRYDASADAYIGIPATYSNAKITSYIPGVGIYVFVNLGVNLPVPSLYAQARTTDDGVEVSIEFYRDGTETVELGIDVTTSSDNELSCTRSTTTARATAGVDVAASVFWDISLETEEQVEATLEYHYDQTEIEASGYSEASLQFVFWDEDAEAWVEPEVSGSVDVEANVVVQSTTHFSEWTVVAQASAASSAPIRFVSGLFAFAVVAATAILF